MKAALFSDQECAATPAMHRAFLGLIGGSRLRAAYIPSAAHPEHLYYRRKREYYAMIGIDLSVYVPPDEELSAELRRTLADCDVVHLSGGNTFVFMDWLRRWGFFEILRAYSRAGGVLVGESAGAILLTPDVRSASLAGDVPPAGVTGGEALGLVSFHFWPHYTGESSPAAEAILAELPVAYGCPDGGGLLVDGDNVAQFGDVAMFCAGAKRKGGRESSEEENRIRGL